MRTAYISAFVFMLLLLANFSYAATVSEAALQVTDYSVVPSTAYPGTKGYIQMTMENTGTGTASGINIAYSNNYNYETTSIYPSDIASGSNSQVSIPFEIPTPLSTGIILYKMDVYYLATSNGGSSKLTTFSVPIVVSQSDVLQVDTLSVGKESMTPGEKTSVTLNIRNNGGTINDLSISSQNSSFSIDGSTRKYVGSIDSNSNQTITLDLVSSSLASVGQYLIALTFTYEDSLENPATQTLYVGPVKVLEPSTQFKVSLVPLSSTEIGSTTDFSLTLENGGTGTTSATVVLGSTDTFTPLGTGKAYFESVEPGKSVSEKVSIGISASVSSGYYELPLNVTLSTGKTFTQKVGIYVEATPEIKITGERSTSTTGSELVIQISNIGNTAIRSVYAVVDVGGVKTEKFIGTMSIDDYSTVSISSTSSATGTASGSSFQPEAGGPMGPGNSNGSQQGPQFNRTQQAQSVKVTVTFKDEQNQPHTVTETLNIKSAGTGQTTITRTTKSNGILFGLDAIQLGGIVIVLVGAGYYLYKRRKRKQVAEE